MDITVKDVKKYLNHLAAFLEGKAVGESKPNSPYSAALFYDSNIIYDFVMKLERVEENGLIKKFEEAA